MTILTRSTTSKRITLGVLFSVLSLLIVLLVRHGSRASTAKPPVSVSQSTSSPAKSQDTQSELSISSKYFADSRRPYAVSGWRM